MKTISEWFQDNFFKIVFLRTGNFFDNIRFVMTIDDCRERQSELQRHIHKHFIIGPSHFLKQVFAIPV